MTRSLPREQEKIEELLCHPGANGVQSRVAGTGTAVAIAVEAREWIAAATAQVCASVARLRLLPQ